MKKQRYRPATDTFIILYSLFSILYSFITGLPVLDIPVPDARLYPLFREMIVHPLGKGDAAVLPARASERDNERGLPLAYIQRYEKIHHIEQLRLKLL